MRGYVVSGHQAADARDTNPFSCPYGKVLAKKECCSLGDTA